MRPHARDVAQSGQQMFWNTLNTAETGLKCAVAAALRPLAGKPRNAATAGRRGCVGATAMQQGRYAGKSISGRVSGKSPARPFRYFDKGNMAVVGKGFAVLQSGRVRISGFIAWLAWAAVHLQFLGQSSLRVSVFVQWVWTYLTGQRGSRLIVAPASEPSPAIASAPRSAVASSA